ncbi:hypothetical protein [Spongiimicrobium sp. 2-473A-2-J]|uniref:hypothetical protein n=1 Tax=Eudoraea algarum TaxID=3417568 RepID=UPI003D362D98
MRLNNIGHLQGKVPSLFFAFLPVIFCCFLLLILSSCSDSHRDSIASDIIVGKWKIYRLFESDIEVDISLCDATWIVEFKADKSIDSYHSDPQNYPDECPPKISQAGWNWMHRGNNHYEIRYLDEQGEIDIFYKDKGHLVRELHNGTTIVVYESYR